MDNIFIIKQFLARRRHYNIGTCLLSVNYVKAFDFLLRKELWEIRNEEGFPTHLTRTVQNTKIQP
jgi:hypothetical protein